MTAAIEELCDLLSDRRRKLGAEGRLASSLLYRLAIAVCLYSHIHHQDITRRINKEIEEKRYYDFEQSQRNASMHPPTYGFYIIAIANELMETFGKKFLDMDVPQHGIDRYSVHLHYHWEPEHYMMNGQIRWKFNSLACNVYRLLTFGIFPLIYNTTVLNNTAVAVNPLNLCKQFELVNLDEDPLFSPPSMMEMFTILRKLILKMRKLCVEIFIFRLPQVGLESSFATKTLSDLNKIELDLSVEARLNARKSDEESDWYWELP